MTLSTTQSRVNYLGAGSTGPFAIPFRFFTNADLLVTKRSTLGVDSTLTLTTDYTLTGAGNATGTLTLVTALATGEVLTIRRVPALTQAVDLRNQGPYYGATHEDALDRLVMQLQELRDELSRAVRIKESWDPALLSLLLKPETGKALVWQSATELGNSTLDSSSVALPGESRTVATLSAYLLNNRVFNVRDYGAVGDNSTDDYAAIQAAITAAAAATSGMAIVYLPVGLYRISEGLTVPGGVTLQGAGAYSDASGFGTDPRTQIRYTKTSGIAITLLGSATEGHKSIHLRDFVLLGTADADGGILVGSAAGGAQQVNHSSIKNVTVNGFPKANAYGLSFRRMLTSVIENVLTIGCYDGFLFPSTANVTTLRFVNCHAYTSGRNGLRFSTPTGATSLTFIGFVAESSQAAGVYIDAGQFITFYDLYCEANNLASGAAPIMVLGSGATPSQQVLFVTPYVQDPAGGTRSFDFANAQFCQILYPLLSFASTDWCAVTAATVQCITHTQQDMPPSTVTGNAAGRMTMVSRPKSRRSGATSVADGGTIAHGLGITPSRASATASVASEFVSVTGLDATNITVAIKKHDNAAGTTQTVYWEAEV